MRNIDETILVNKSLPKTWTCPHCGKRTFGGFEDHRQKVIAEMVDLEQEAGAGRRADTNRAGQRWLREHWTEGRRWQTEWLR